MNDENEIEIGSMMTTVQVGKIFSVKAETIRDWIMQGKLPGATRINGVWRIPEASVRALAAGKVG